jgi:hypothetical protein
MWEYVVEVWWDGKGKRQAIETCRLEATAQALAWDYKDEGHRARVRVVKHRQEG